MELNQSHPQPSVFIVGAAKAGTTSLYRYLSQHPQIFACPVKEPNYFATDININNLRPQLKKRLANENFDIYLRSGIKKVIHNAFITDRNQYLQLFSNAGKDQKCFEASASYLFSSTAAKEIFKFNPHAKIIMILRNPAERAYSHFLMDTQLGFTDDNFKTAIEKDILTKDSGWGASSNYINTGKYFTQVKRYTETFHKNQVLILLFEDLKSNKCKIIKDVFDFIGVNSEFDISSVKDANVSVIPRNDFMRRLIKLHSLRISVRYLLQDTKLKYFLKKIIFKSPPNHFREEKFKNDLKDYFRSDIISLSQLINRDLTSWM